MNKSLSVFSCFSLYRAIPKGNQAARQHRARISAYLVVQKKKKKKSSAKSERRRRESQPEAKGCQSKWCNERNYQNVRYVHYQGGDTRIPLTWWSVGHVSRQPNHWALLIQSYYYEIGLSLVFSCIINMQNLNQSVIYGITTTDFITVLCRLINCSTPKTASYNYLLAKLLWNVKFYLNQIFTNFFHKLVWRSVKLRWEILNLDSKIKHLRPVYKKDIEKLRRRQQS